jgi:arylsulfatase A-like enzyme
MLVACALEKGKAFNSSHDILQVFKAQTQEETSVLNFRKEANPDRFLLQGWNRPEEEETWASANKSSVLFYKYNEMNDLDVEITCRSIPSKNRSQQNMIIFLNEHRIDSISVEPQKFQTFNCTLPASFMKTGENRLQFRFSYCLKSRDIDENASDSRNLSVAFRKIRFRKKFIHLEDGELIHHAGSAFSFLCELSEKFELDIRYKNEKSAKAFIELINTEEEKRIIKLPKKGKTFKKTLRVKDEGLYKLRFVTNGDAHSFTSWSRISLNTFKANDVIQPGYQSIQELSKPDILLYVVDALRADHLSCYGYGRRTSPNIDRFAEENSLYLNAYANDSWTKPSCASILTGLFPKNHKTMKREDRLPEEVVSLAEALKDNGYYTVAWVSNGNLSRVFGFAQGFDQFKELLGKYPARTVQSDVINENVFEFLNTYLKRKERKPLFMLIWTMDPHDPYTPQDSVKEMFDIHQYEPIDTYDFELLPNIERRKIQPTPSQIEYMKTRYDQEIYFNDLSFGRLIDKMRDFDIYDDAVIIFTGDHGEEFFDHDGIVHGMTLYNEQVKIPFSIRASQIESGMHNERMQHIDIYPTILDMLNIHEPYALDGISLLDDSAPQRTLYFEEALDGNDLNAILDRNKKLIYNKHFRRKPPQKYVPVLELYDIKDSQEQVNLEFRDLRDYLRLQQLFAHRNGRSELGLKREKVEIPPDLEKKLRALGYIK